MRDKFRELRIAWKAILLGLRVAPDHREEPRTYEWNEDVRGLKSIIFILPGGQYIAKGYVWKQIRYSLPGWLWVVVVSIRGHPLLRRVCTSVTHGIAFQAILNIRNLDSLISIAITKCTLSIKRTWKTFQTYPPYLILASMRFCENFQLPPMLVRCTSVPSPL